MALSDEQLRMQRAGIPDLEEKIQEFNLELDRYTIPERAYDFDFQSQPAKESELRDYQMQIDMDHDSDLDQLQRWNDRAGKDFLKQIAKLDEAIRDQEREEFKVQDEQYAHLKAIPQEWELHKNAQEWEGKEREKLRGVFYTNVIRDFIDAQEDRFENRVEALQHQNDANVQRLNEVYAEHSPNLEGIAQALEEAKSSIQHINPPRPANDEISRPVAVGMSRDTFHSLVLAGQEHERENER